MFTLACLLVAAVAGPAQNAHAQPRGVRLTHYGDPTRSIAVSWNSASASDNQVVVGTSAADLSRTVTATDTFAMRGALGTGFSARVDGLDPSTLYYYRVGHAGAWRPAESSPPYSFRTLPADRCAPLRVIIIGDNRSDFDGSPNPLWPDIMDEAVARMPDLLVNTGDMVKNGDAVGEWSDFIDDSESGFAAVPSIATMGNHDEDALNGDGALYNQLFELARNSRTDTEDYYSLDVGPIHVVSLNTQFTRPGTTELTEMVAWLGADLSASTQPWTIVFFHKAVYSRGNHHTGEENGGSINSTFTPIFDAHDVDLVFNGHSHDYERYAPTTGLDREFGGSGRMFPAGAGSVVRGLATVPDGVVGTTYIVTGGAGALTTAGIPGTSFCEDISCTYCLPFVNMCSDEVLDNDRNGTVVFNGLHNFVVLEIEGADIRAEVWATEAGNLGRGGVVLDSFTMTKSTWPGDVCGTTPTPDGGVPSPDGGPGVDAGVPPGTDAGVPPRTDAGTTAGRDSGTTTGADDGGCGCRLAGNRSGGPALPVALLLTVAALWQRRRTR